jgi:MYXO-CTERM domain-containing protein
VVQAVNTSVGNWQKATLDAGCSYLKIDLDAPAPLEAHLDHINVLKFRGDKWCRPAEKNTAEMCYSAQAAAITTIFYTADGTMVDADIELNEINFTFVWLPASVTPRPGTMASDIENTLTHELGHFQGLDHTCWDHAVATDPVDDMNMPVPDCNDVLAHKVPDAEYTKIVQATMFNFASPGETIKRTPKADDIGGICAICPKTGDPAHCERPAPISSGGCSLGGGRGRLGGGLALFALGLLAARRQRRRMRSRG